MMDYLKPPSFCQYANGPCDQDLSECVPIRAFFIYPSDPVLLAQTVRNAVTQLSEHSRKSSWVS